MPLGGAEVDEATIGQDVDAPAVGHHVLTREGSHLARGDCLLLQGAELELVNVENRETKLRDALRPALASFDYIIVDCPPSLGLITLNVLTAAPGFTASNIRHTALLADGQTQNDTPRDEAKMMTSEEVARRISQAVAKRQLSFVLTGEGKLVVFLNKWLPGLMDKMVLNNFRKEEGEL